MIQLFLEHLSRQTFCILTVFSFACPPPERHQKTRTPPTPPPYLDHGRQPPNSHPTSSKPTDTVKYACHPSPPHVFQRSVAIIISSTAPPSIIVGFQQHRRRYARLSVAASLIAAAASTATAAGATNIVAQA